MKTKLRTAKVGMTVLMVLSIFTGIALADPPSGEDAGNTYGSATLIDVPYGNYDIFSPGLLADNVDWKDKDWYHFTASSGDKLSYDLDINAYNDDVDMEIHTFYDGHIISEIDKGNPGGYIHPVTLDSSNPHVKIYDSSYDPFYEDYKFILGLNL